MKTGAFCADRDDTWAVKIVREETLISCGPFAKSTEWKAARNLLVHYEHTLVITDREPILLTA